MTDFFALLQLPVTFDLDVATLEQHYRAQQQQFHPDRFATHAVEQQRWSMEQATQLNEAWQTLREPLARAVYLLQRMGYQPVSAEQGRGDQDAAFLMQVMEWREALAEIDPATAAALPQLVALRQQMEREMEQVFAHLAALFKAVCGADQTDRSQLEPMARLIDQQRYRRRFLAEIDQIEEQVVERIESDQHGG
ncbi:MAG: Fe-S protein assembly co-chaperone HscB [Magnetococcales bacterium]|nr:Fe-S protein assembly co-chaperone HscB [Magnetococcales bacterium]